MQEAGSLHSAERDSKTFKDAVDLFVSDINLFTGQLYVNVTGVNIGSLSCKHSAVDRVRMHTFEPKIEDLTGFNNYGDTLMKEEFVFLGNTSSMR